MQLTDTTIDNFAARLANLGHSPNTIRAYTVDLRDLQTFLAGAELTEEGASAWMNEGRLRWAPKTTGRRLASLRRYAKETDNVEKYLDGYKPPKAAKGKSHPLNAGIEGVTAMIDVAETSRRAALVALCGLVGARVHEAVKVTPADIDIEKMYVRLHGKGAKERDVPINEAAWKVIEPVYNELVAKPGGWNTSITRFKERQARRIVTHLAKRAGLGHAASHDLRMTFGSELMDKTGNIEIARELLGHESVLTTQLYSGASAKMKRDAVEALR